jgi:hypothetical protein
MNINNLFTALLLLGLFGIAVPYAKNAHCAEMDSLDVNLNPIYISVKPHQSLNVQSEIIFQIPMPMNAKAENTGLGPIAAIAYFDNKELIHIQNESATVRGAGRFYYFQSAYGTEHTLVPYFTFYRDLVIDYSNAVGKKFSSKNKSWLPPGVLYAYRVSERLALHFEAELYSYSSPSNNISRIGASYALSKQWVASASYERLAWDIKDSANSQNVFMQGSSNNIYLKLMSSKPLKDNFAFILGYAADRNSAGPGMQQKSNKNTNGLFLGVEASLGTLVW